MSETVIEKEKKAAHRILAAIDNELWLITESALDQIRAIAGRAHDVEAISKYAGANQSRDLVSIVGSTAILNIRGPMARYSDMFSDISGMSSTEKLSAAFAELDADEQVSRIILEIDSPGGTVNGIAEFAELIASAATPVVSHITGLGASAAYWVASQTDAIYVSRTAITGSIGVRGEAPDKPGEKTIVSKYAPAKAGSASASKALIDRVETEFHEAVASGRGVTVEHVREHFGQGGVFVGGDAVDAGLADSVATLDQILAGTVGMPPVRRTTSTSDQGDPMTPDKNTGGITTAEHEQAIADAREAGKAEGLQASAETAVTAERERVTAIIAAGQGKPAKQVETLIAKGIDAETAVEILASAPDAITGGTLSAQMDGTNPTITNDAQPSNGEDTSASVWDAFAGDDK